MQRFTDNPFHVLGLKPWCVRADVEREGQKVLGMLELGLHQARTYVTPLGERQRTAELIGWAMAELRDPEKRAQHEVWAQLDADTALPDGASPTENAAHPAGALAMRVLGWGR